MAALYTRMKLRTRSRNLGLFETQHEVYIVMTCSGLFSRRTVQLWRFVLTGIILVGLPGLSRASTIALSSLGNSIGGNLGSGNFETEGATALDLTGSDFTVSAATRPE